MNSITQEAPSAQEFISVETAFANEVLLTIESCTDLEELKRVKDYLEKFSKRIDLWGKNGMPTSLKWTFAAAITSQKNQIEQIEKKALAVA